MTSIIKKVMRFYWHHSQAYSLISLPINGLGALSSLLVLFTVISGVKFAWWIYVGLFVSSTFLLFSLGIVAKSMGLLSYWQSLNNNVNPELLEILAKISGKGAEG